MNCKILFSLPVFFITTLHGSAQNNAYRQEIADWHAKRIQGLKAENGWLNLAGLFWLEKGKNNFGSGVKNNIVFPVGAIAKNAGYFERSGDSVTMIVDDNIEVEVNGQKVSEQLLFQNDSSPSFVARHGSLSWTIIKRGERIGVRLRNLNSSSVTGFKDIPRFPVNSFWRINATLQTVNVPDSILITNVLGQTARQKTAGRLAFTINNKPYSLIVLEEGDELFIIFGDTTNKKETYPAGRFLYAKKPGADGRTVLDFNKAINPPCAFTPYATCPLPPKQNRLNIAIMAGEKRFEH